MTRRLLVSYVSITLFVLAILALPLGVTFAAKEEEHLVATMERGAHDLAASLAGWVAGTADVDADDLVASYEAQAGGRAVVVDRSGLSLADSEAGRGRGEDFSNRAEIRSALAGRVATGVRPSNTAGGDLVFVAVPVRSGLDVVGAVRVTYPRATLDARVRSVWVRLGALSAVVLVAVVVVGWFLARSVSGPLRELEEASGRMAGGDLATRVGDLSGPHEVRHLAAAFDRMAGRLEAGQRVQRGFLADASHQLRTPLTALRLRIESLPLDAPSETVEAAGRELDRLSALVDGLLALSRLEAASRAPEPTDLAAAVSERCDLWEPLCSEEGVHLVADVAPAVVVCLPDGVGQVLDNLLANALDVSDPGDTIRVGVARRDGTVRLSVSDDGPGLDDDELERAFDRFWRPARATPGGTGLGLAIVAEIARGSGGSAGMRRRRDEPVGSRGLEVWVDLPAAVAGVGSSSVIGRG